MNIIRIKYLYCFTCIFLCSACSTVTTAKQEGTRRDSVLAEAVSEHRPMEPAKSPDAQQIDTTASVEPVLKVYPPEVDYPIPLLLPGHYQLDDLEQSVFDMNWMGLFRSEDGKSSLRNVDLAIDEIPDPLSDMPADRAPTVWDVTLENNPGGLWLQVFIASEDLLEQKDIRTVSFTPGPLLPGKDVQFDFNGEQYRVFATANKGEGVGEWKDYRIFITKDQGRKQMLAATPFFDDAMMQLLFIGDIDADQKPDLLIQTSNHYSVGRPVLYLSSLTEDGDCVGVAGLFRRTGL